MINNAFLKQRLVTLFFVKKLQLFFNIFCVFRLTGLLLTVTIKLSKK